MALFIRLALETRYWLKPISLQERQSNDQSRVITYVRRATRNYPVIFGNVANGDILRAHFSRLLQGSEIYCPGFVASDII